MDNKLEHASERRLHNLEHVVGIAQKSAEKKKGASQHEQKEIAAPSDLSKKF